MKHRIVFAFIMGIVTIHIASYATAREDHNNIFTPAFRMGIPIDKH